MKTIIGIFGLIQVHVEGGVLGIRKFVGITQCFESDLCGKFYIIVGLISLAFIIYNIYSYRKPNNEKNKKELIIEIIMTPLFIITFTSMLYSIVKFSTFFILLMILLGLWDLLGRVIK